VVARRRTGEIGYAVGTWEFTWTGAYGKAAGDHGKFHGDLEEAERWIVEVRRAYLEFGCGVAGGRGEKGV